MKIQMLFVLLGLSSISALKLYDLLSLVNGVENENEIALDGGILTEKCGNTEFYPKLQKCCYNEYTVNDYLPCGCLLPTVTHGCCNTSERFLRETHECCADEIILRLEQGCCTNAIYSRDTSGCCKDKVYALDTHGCCNGQKYKRKSHGCCTDTLYDILNQGCCNGERYYRKTHYYEDGEIKEILKPCVESTYYKCCRGKQYFLAHMVCYQGELLTLKEYFRMFIKPGYSFWGR